MVFPRTFFALAAVCFAFASCGNNDYVRSGAETSGAAETSSAETSDSAIDSQPDSIDGEWELQSLAVDGTEVNISSTSAIPLFIRGGNLKSHDGCNEFSSGFFTGEDSSISVNPVFNSNDKGCPPSSGEFRRKYTAGLKQATSYSVSDGELTLRSDSSTLVFVVAPPTLKGSWELESINIDGADVVNLSVSPVTLSVDQGSWENGKTKCGRNSGGTFSIEIMSEFAFGEDNSFSIPEFDETDKGCSPAAVSEFENTYMKGLQEVTSFSFPSTSLPSDLTRQR